MWSLLLASALAAPPNSDQPPRLYLDEPLVRPLLHALLPGWAPCFADVQAPDASWELAVTVHPDGSLTDPVLAPADPVRQACLAAALEGPGLPPHHEDPLALRTILVPRAGVLVPHPLVELSHRPDALLFVYVADPDQAAALRAALGQSDTAD